MKAEAESSTSAFVYFYKSGSDIIIFLSENANIEKIESEKIKDKRNAENLLQQKSKCATIDEVRRR